MNRIQTRALVEGSIFAAITVMIGIIKFYIPVIAVISIVWSVPTILIAFRHGFKVSVYSAIVSSILVTIMTQPIEGLGFFIGFGLPGIVMGYLLKKKLSPEKIILITGFVLAICGFVSIYLAMLAVGTDIIKAYDKLFIEMQNAYNEAINSMSDAYSKMGIRREDLLKGSEAFAKNLELVKMIVPAGILMSGIIMSFINFKLTRLVLKKINYYINDVKPFSQWALSNKWKIIVMSILLCTAVELYLVKLPQLNILSMNIFSIITAILALQGLSVIKFYLDKYAVPKALKVIIILLLFYSLGNVILLISVFDMLFDLRKLQESGI